MYQCTHCQAELPANAQFCNHCGMTVAEHSATSASFKQTEAREEELEVTAKLPAVAASTIPSTPDAPAPPNPRTRRIHTPTSISTFPQDPWLPSGTNQEEKGTRDSKIESSSPQVSPVSVKSPLTPPVEPPEEEAGFDVLENSVQSLIAESEEPAMADSKPISPFIIPSRPITPTPADALAHTPAFAPGLSGPITPTPTDALAHTPAPAPSLFEQGAPAPADALPLPERRSTPRPASMALSTPLPPLAKHKSIGAFGSRTLLAAILVILIVLAGGAGIFALTQQRIAPGSGAQCTSQQGNCAGSPTKGSGKISSLALSGTLTGSLSVIGKTTCQRPAAGNLRTLLVNLSGTLGTKLYNFGFTLQHYGGPATYTNNIPDTTIRFDAPGDLTNGWGNSDPTDIGTITVARGEQSGNISYTLSGTGTNAKTQLQITGNWICSA
ncbi:MAG TPA: zinc-ribbon domain-containing protein [Ktedonobacteraceae bacterium]